MNFPENLKYTKDHEWLRIEGNTGYVGITDFAQGELGDVVFVEIETLGETLSKGDVFGTIEAVKTVSDMFMPVGGEILEVNPAIEESPDVVNKDPYGKGWILVIEASNFDEEVGNLMKGSGLVSFIEAEVKRAEEEKAKAK